MSYDTVYYNMIKYNVILCSILFYSILLYEALAAPAVRIMGVREHGHPPPDRRSPITQGGPARQPASSFAARRCVRPWHQGAPGVQPSIQAWLPPPRGRPSAAARGCQPTVGRAAGSPLARARGRRSSRASRRSRPSGRRSAPSCRCVGAPWRLLPRPLARSHARSHGLLATAAARKHCTRAARCVWSFPGRPPIHDCGPCKRPSVPSKRPATRPVRSGVIAERPAGEGGRPRGAAGRGGRGGRHHRRRPGARGWSACLWFCSALVDTPSHLRRPIATAAAHGGFGIARPP